MVERIFGRRQGERGVAFWGLLVAERGGVGDGAGLLAEAAGSTHQDEEMRATLTALLVVK